ncbi:MAG: LPS export ABC transporter periplasmic protein LptC, partial [Acidobacteria bacterium]|nr:LPS export ABC transporter periplasmic protein LptC [Acidobacteriota bacterium]
MGERTRVWIRWVTWLLMVVVVAVIVMLAVERSRRLRPAVVRLGSAAPGETSGEDGGRTIGVSQGFEFTESVSGKTLFILNAARTLGLTSGWTHIEKVRFRWFGEDGNAVELSCDSARFNPQTRDAELIGAVHIRLPDGAFLDTARGHFDASTQKVRSEARVLFSNGETAGEAGSAIYLLSKGKLLLGGGVVARERSGRTLRAPSLEYDRQSGWAVFPEGVEMSDPSMEVRAPHARVRMDAEDGAPRQIDLEGGVNMDSTDLPGGGSFSGWAERLRGTRDAGGQWQIIATTSGPWVRLDLVDTPDTVLRRLQTWRLRAVVGEDGPIKAVFESRLCIEDIPREAMPRWAAARGGQLWFEGGEPTGFEMKGEVWLRAEGYTVTADAARFLDQDEKVILSSDPSQRRRATVRSAGFTVSAQRVEGF